MKKHVPFLFLVGFLCCSYAYAQTYTGNLTLSSQAEVNALNYSVVTGRVLIGVKSGSSDITDLSPLSKLNSVGSLQIFNNDKLENLKGLEGLQAVEKILYISDNDLLADLQGLGNLLTVGNNLYISYNKGLANLKGMDKLKTIGRDLFISTNNSLQSLEGIEELQSIKGSLIINKNPVLYEVSALSNIDMLPGNLVVEQNVQLTICCTLKDISASGYSRISGNSGPCNSIQNIKDFCGLIYEGDLTISTQQQVRDFKYTGVTGRLTIGVKSGTSDINELRYFSKLAFVGDLYIINNDELAYLLHFNALREVNNLYIADNDKLKMLQGFDNLKTIKGNLYVTYNDGITSLRGLNNVQSVGRDIYIHSNNKLQNLSGSGRIRSLGGSLIVSNNNSLNNINSFSNSTITDISVLNRVAGNLIIRNNPYLRGCCTLLGIRNVGGKKIIENNTESCSATADLGEPCGIYYGDLTIKTQKGVEEFPYLKVIGTLTFGSTDGQSDINNFSYFEPQKGSPFFGVLSHGEQKGILRIIGNDQLQTLQGLRGLYAENLEITDNKHLSNLTDIRAFPGYLKISGDLGTTTLQSIGHIDFQEVYIENTPLISLQGLQTASTMRGLSIIANNELTDISAINSTSTISGDLVVTDNTKLTTCCAFTDIAVIGNTIISNNASGCNSVSEIQEVCIESASAMMMNKSHSHKEGLTTLLVYPNPTSNILHLNNYHGKAILINAFGQHMQAFELNGHNQIDLSRLPAGTYILQIKDQESVRIIKR